MAEPRKIRITVNGQAREGWAEPRRLLVDFLREDLGLTGTHVGCEHGICGACTVMLNGEAARSCLMLAVQADGAELMTVEGLARDGKLHPLQEAFWEHHGLQCGFCTPGMLMAAYDFLRVNPDPSEEEIREALSAVLCRCTGYQGIVRAVKAAAERMRSARDERPNERQHGARLSRNSRAAQPRELRRRSPRRGRTRRARRRMGRGPRVHLRRPSRAHQPLRQRAVRARRGPMAIT